MEKEEMQGWRNSIIAQTILRFLGRHEISLAEGQSANVSIEVRQDGILTSPGLVIQNADGTNATTLDKGDVILPLQGQLYGMLQEDPAIKQIEIQVRGLEDCSVETS